MKTDQNIDVTTENTAASSREVNEGELSEVAGGAASEDKCYFEPSPEMKRGELEHFYWMRCTNIGLRCLGCSCRHTPQCVDNFHKMDEFDELMPTYFANHRKKDKWNRYRTP